MKLGDSTFVTVDQHGEQFAFAAADKAHQSLVALLPDRHPPGFELDGFSYRKVG